MKTLKKVLNDSRPVLKGSLRKPIFRSSGLFPVYEEDGIQTRLTFLGYWLLRGRKKEVGIYITIRNKIGKKVLRKYLIIDKPKIFTFYVKDLLKEINLSSPFHGSIEMEVFSNGDLVFPFPAVVLNYFGENFSTAVHSCQRVFNDAEDSESALSLKVPEGSFNIYGSEDLEPFIDFVNGPIEKKDCILKCKVLSINGSYELKNISLGLLKPYQRVIFKPGDYFNLKSLLEDKPGTLTFFHPFTDVFPRFIAGNRQKSLKSLSITHTIYGTSQIKDYWESPGEYWYSGARMIPTLITKGMYTKVYFYPNASQSELALDFELFNSSGTQLGFVDNVASITSPNGKVCCVDIREIAEKNSINVKDISGTRIIARPLNHSKMPARLSVCIDIGTLKSKGLLPTNISFSLVEPNINREGRGSFRWGPILEGKKISYISISNSSVLKSQGEPAEALLNIYRKKDERIMKKNYIIPDNGSLLLEINKGSKIYDFLQGDIGWYTVSTNNANLNTWYLVRDKSGIMGGDHGF